MTGGPQDVQHDEWAALAVGHAMSSLEPEEQDAFLRHLPRCSACAEVVAETTIVMGNLAYAVEPADPPDSVWEAISAGIGPRPAAAVAGPESAPRAVAVPRRRRPIRSVRAPWLAIAAGLILLMGLSVWNVLLQAENRAQQRRLQQAALVTSCFHERDCSTVELRTPGGTPAVTALVRSTQVELVSTQLARNDTKAETYVLWEQVATRQMVAVTTFDVTKRGTSVIQVGRLRTPLGPGTLLAVSREPGRQAPAAPSSIVVSGTAQQG